MCPADEVSRRHIFGNDFDAGKMKVYGPGRHFRANLNGSVIPGRVAGGNPSV